MTPRTTRLVRWGLLGSFGAVTAAVAWTLRSPGAGGQPALPKPGDGGQPPPANELDEINRMQAQPDPKQPGKRLYETNQDHRHAVEARRRAYFAKQQAAA